MFALVLITLFAGMTAATADVLADSALRPTSGAARPALLRPAALRTANRGISRAA